MTQPAYVVAHLHVKDFDEYLSTYGAGFIDVLPQFEGEVLAATQDGTIVEGEDNANWTVLLRFPSRELADAFYHSDVYAPLIELRTKTLGTTGSIYMFSGLPTQG